MKKILISISIAVAMFSTACAVDRDYDTSLFDGDDRLVDMESIDDETFNNERVEEMPVTNDPYGAIKVDPNSGLIDGSIGSSDFNDDNAEVYANIGPNFSDFEFLLSRGTTSGMVVVNMFESVDLTTMEAGEVVTLRAGFNSATNASVGGLACSGSVGSWEYDQPIDSVTVGVDEGPEEGTLVMSLSVEQNGQTSTGSFLYSR